MIVVSDTSPIGSLFLIDRLDLLPAIFGEVVVPEQVFQELLVLETDFGYDLSILKNASWLIRCPVSDVQSVNLLKRELDAGESEAIVLAKELQADFLLIDESEGRTIALREGLQIIGLLGVLIQAKHRKLIPAIKPVVAELRQIAGFYLSESLVQNILQQMGE